MIEHRRKAHASARRRGAIRWAAIGAVASLAIAGCYRRTVEAKGIGARDVDTHEPNLQTGDDRSPVDRAVDSIIEPPRQNRLEEDLRR